MVSTTTLHQSRSIHASYRYPPFLRIQLIGAICIHPRLCTSIIEELPASRLLRQAHATRRTGRAVPSLIGWMMSFDPSSKSDVQYHIKLATILEALLVALYV